jgi:hypothetical protein
MESHVVNDIATGTAEHRVDWIRGARDHVLATDLLGVAPILPESQKLEFFFHSATTCCGRWLASDGAQERGIHEEVVASLRISDPHGTRKWGFVVDNLSPITRRVADLSEDSIISSALFNDGGIHTVMTDAFSVWEHLIWGTKALGQVLFPGVSWYIAYVVANLGQFPRVTSGCTLSLHLHRKRLAIHEVKFAIDGTPLGSVGARERA